MVHWKPINLFNLHEQVVNLPNLRIIDFSYGRTGSTHDSLAFKDTRVFQQHADLFPDGEWIWADSAYTVRYLFSSLVDDYSRFISSTHGLRLH